MATLPLAIDNGSGDGVVLASVGRGRAGRQSGLKLKDVITSIDGEAVGDLNDFVRILSEKQPGDEVTVAYRRGKLHGEVRLALVAEPDHD
jgi:S1-C subfamily serine protease